MCYSRRWVLSSKLLILSITMAKYQAFDRVREARKGDDKEHHIRDQCTTRSRKHNDDSRTSSLLILGSPSDITDAADL